MIALARFSIPLAVAILLHLLACHKQANQNNTTGQSDTLSPFKNQSANDLKTTPDSMILTTERIDTISDDKLLEMVFHPLVDKLPKDYTRERETVLRWTKGQKAIFVIQFLEAEVNNGGFNQYYFNSSGQYADVTPAALALIGATQYADLVTRVNAVYEKEHDRITAQQDGTLEGFSKSYDDNPLNKFDHEFYELEKVENLQKLQVDFIRKHKAEFIAN